MTAREDALVGEACDPRDGLDDGAGLAEGGAAVCSSRTHETVCRSGNLFRKNVSHGLLVGGGTQLLQPKGK